MSINNALRLCRAYSVMSVKEMAVAINYTPAHISHVESGRVAPGHIMLQKYAEWLGVPISSLMKFSESLTDDNLQNLTLFLEMKNANK